jgi:hypothetical protein
VTRSEIESQRIQHDYEEEICPRIHVNILIYEYPQTLVFHHGVHLIALIQEEQWKPVRGSRSR